MDILNFLPKKKKIKMVALPKIDPFQYLISKRPQKQHKKI